MDRVVKNGKVITEQDPKTLPPITIKMLKDILNKLPDECDECFVHTYSHHVGAYTDVYAPCKSFYVSKKVDGTLAFSFLSSNDYFLEEICSGKTKVVTDASLIKKEDVTYQVFI